MKKLTTMVTVMAMGVAAVFADAKGTEIMTKVHDVKKPEYTVAKASNSIYKRECADNNRWYCSFVSRREEITEYTL